MEPQFVDRILICADCRGEFIFTAGEQLFFHDKQFKNDPKRCKPCKSRRSGLAAGANGTGPAAAGLSRTETRTECSECGVQTTVPFKPTQGRPVLCRQCFQARNKAAAAAVSVPATPTVPPPSVLPGASISPEATAARLAVASSEPNGMQISPDAAIAAAASMAAASPQSSVASPADLAAIASNGAAGLTAATPAAVPAELLSTVEAEPHQLQAALAETPAEH